MYIIMNTGDKGQEDFIKWEAGLTEEDVHAFSEDCFRADQEDPTSQFSTDTRITFRGHGSFDGSYFGVPQEASHPQRGYTAQQFVEKLIEYQLPRSVEQIDLIGCQIGLSKIDRPSFIEEVARLLREFQQYQHISIRGLLYRNRLRNEVFLLVHRPYREDQFGIVPQIAKVYTIRQYEDYQGYQQHYRELNRQILDRKSELLPHVQQIENDIDVCRRNMTELRDSRYETRSVIRNLLEQAELLRQYNQRKNNLIADQMINNLQRQLSEVYRQILQLGSVVGPFESISSRDHVNSDEFEVRLDNIHDLTP